MTHDSDRGEDLRAALARLAEVAGDGTVCPAPDLVVSSARQELSRADDREIVFHLARCSACGAAWRVAREVARESRQAPVSTGRLRWVAVAAMLIGAVGAAVLYVTPHGDRSPVYREQQADTLESRLSEAEPLSRTEFLLRWVAAPEGSSYDVVVTDERMRTLARAFGLTVAEYRVPVEALEGVESGQRLFWRVSARLPDGRRIESATFIARVR